MASFLNRFREDWLRPVLFFGNNPVSLTGGAITTASAVAMVGFWALELFGRAGENPYLGIIFFLILPIFFVIGLLLIPAGSYWRWRKLSKSGQLPAEYPRIDFKDPIFRHGVDIVLIATVVNLLIVVVASYRGASYMDSSRFCGQSCHVMHPEYEAYKISAHAHVECVSCHIGSGASSYLRAKVNGAKQVLEMAFGSYPKPIPSPVTTLRPAREICEGCHTPARYIGEKLLVKSSFADDEKNSETQSVVVLHLGGRDSLSHLTGIHGVHLGHIEYITTEGTRTEIPWVKRWNADGSATVYATEKARQAEPRGERRTMDCVDCHNRASHTMQTAEDALNRAMVEGAVAPELPYIHKVSLELLKAEYASTEEARSRIPAALAEYYRRAYPAVAAAKADKIKLSGEGLVYIFTHNVSPEMKVSWGTHPNHIGHMSYPGCFRCHDGDHAAPGGKSIPNDCAACHNLLAVDEPTPKVLTDLGFQ